MNTTVHEEKIWKMIYRLGAFAAYGAVLVGILEIAITYLPGGDAPHETILDWFNLFHDNWFMGLRNMGLLNIFLNVFAVLTYFAFYAAHRKDPNKPFAFLSMIVSYIGVGVFFATNRAFPLWSLSQQYAAAGTESQRAVLEAAGLALLAVGGSHTPGTFLAFFIVELAGLMISVVMLKSNLFGKPAAYAGILGFGALLVFEFNSSFAAGLTSANMLLAMVGGIASMVWYILIARKLSEFGR
jgi:hypothetical protein